MAKVIGIDLGTTNSAVAFTKNGERLVGQVAKRQAITNPDNTIYSVKRLMGRRYTDPEVQRTIKMVPYKIQQAGNGGVEIVLGNGKKLTPPEVSAMILQKLKADSEAHLGEKITQAVITVPAYFDDQQRQATKDAGQIAGLEVLRIINEPTAASLVYGLGGGTFDISVLQLGEGVFEVKATNGDTHLGGDDFDQRVIDWLIDEFKRDQGIDLRGDRQALQRLKEAAEKAKIELSSTQQTEVNLPFITADQSGPKHLVITLTRSKLEQLVGDLVDKTIAPVRQCLKDADVTADRIDEVVLVGGMTRMPLVVETVRKLFAGKEPNKSVNPDEVVAVGAAIQAGVLKGEVKDVLLLDVTPLSLGIETLGGVMTKLIERNTTVPVRRSEVFSTAEDNQTAVDIHVLQGERELARDNRTLGHFRLEGIAPAPRGLSQIEVTFDIDANGILTATARDQATGKEQRITITGSTQLSQEEIDRMVADAQRHAAEDRQQREAVEARNHADTIAYQIERQLHELGDRVPMHERARAENMIQEIRQLVQNQSTDMARLRQLSSDLQQLAAGLAASGYAQETAGSAGRAGQDGRQRGGAADEVIDAEFKPRS